MRFEQISESVIERLVEKFYEKIRNDAALGPIFIRAIPGDWAPHLAIMRDFWSSVMLTSGRYKGNPVAKHLQIEGMQPHLFDQWLKLVRETCDELCEDDLATAFMAKAERIAESLKLSLFYRPDRAWSGSSS
jgi:hemoglobin